VRLQPGADRDADARAALLKRPRIETVIEVIDLSARRVLARARFNGPLGLPFGGGYFSQPTEDAAGEPGVVISRIQIKR